VKNSDPGWKKFGTATLRVADLFHMGPDLDDPTHGQSFYQAIINT
jgi:hypothetical protein